MTTHKHSRRVRYSHPLNDINDLHDQLQRAALVQAIENELRNLEDCPDGHVIGLYGSWGSGKTYVLSQVIRQCLNNNTDEQPVHIIPCLFMAWRYELEGTLAPGLIRSLQQVIEWDEVHTFLPNFKDRLFQEGVKRDIRQLLDILTSLTSVVVPHMQPLAQIARSVYGNEQNDAAVDRVRNQMQQLIERILNQAKKGAEERNQARRNQGKESIQRSYRLVIFVDDLDRCSPENLVRLFEWLKNHFLVENCVYVLALDHVVAARAIVGRYRDYLEEKHDLSYGYRYLEKLIDSEYELEQTTLVQAMAISQIYDSTKTLEDLAFDIAGSDFSGINLVPQLMQMRCLGTPRTTLKILNKFQRAMETFRHPNHESVRNRMVPSYPFWTLFMIAIYFQMGPEDFIGFVQGHSELYKVISGEKKSSDEANWPLSDFINFAVQFRQQTTRGGGSSVAFPDETNRIILSRLIRENTVLPLVD